MEIFLFYLLLALIAATAAYGAWSSAPYLPTRKRDIKRLIGLGGIKSGERVYDLGCGDGRMVFEAAKCGAEAIGIEVFILPYVYARIKSIWHKNSRILYGDLYNFDLRGADAVYIFLMHKAYDKIADKLESELKSGSRVIVYCWPIDRFRDKLVKVDKGEGGELPAYLYKM